MEALEQIKKLYHKHSIEYKSEVENGKEKLTISATEDFNPLFVDELRELNRNIGNQLIYSGALAPIEGGCICSMSVISN
jgi:hypothetical protein